MNTANNQLHQETERRLRQELLCFLEREKEPTVSELCEAAQINRSTFYRHYRDIPDLMEKTEKEIQKGLFRTVGSQGDFLTRLESSSDALEPLISYIGQNRYFYRAYLRKNGDAALEDGYQLSKPFSDKTAEMIISYENSIKSTENAEADQEGVLHCLFRYSVYHRLKINKNSHSAKRRKYHHNKSIV